MTALVIGRAQRKALARLRRLAERHVVDVAEVVEKLKTPEGEEAHRDRMTAQSVPLPMTFLVTFSVEVGHPGGTMRHMSMSTSTEGRVPTRSGSWRWNSALPASSPTATPGWSRCGKAARR